MNSKVSLIKNAAIRAGGYFEAIKKAVHFMNSLFNLLTATIIFL